MILVKFVVEAYQNFFKTNDFKTLNMNIRTQPNLFTFLHKMGQSVVEPYLFSLNYERSAGTHKLTNSVELSTARNATTCAVTR
jgi:hypothetical protein